MRQFSPKRLHPRIEDISRQNYQRLLDTVSEDPVSFHFFTGAGTSVGYPACMPLSSGFQKECLRTLLTYTSFFADDLTRMVSGDLADRADIEALPLETLIQYLKDIEGDSVLSLCQVYASTPQEVRANACHRFLATWLTREYGAVATVNIDRLIEDALPSTWDRSRVHYDLESIHPRPAPGIVYKLHGTVEVTDSLRLSLDRIAPTLTPDASEFFRRFVLEHPVCFVGYAGADLDLRPLILERERVATSAPPAFYCIYPSDHLQTEKDLREKNVKAFEIIDSIGAFPMYADSDCLFALLGKDIFGWKPAPRQEPTQADCFDWEPMKQWAQSVRDKDQLEFVAGRLVGHVYFHLGLYGDSLQAWSKIIEEKLVTTGSQVAKLYRDMAHACFRVPDMKGAYRNNRLGLQAAVQVADELEKALCLFGLGSVPVAWPFSDPIGFVLAPWRLHRAERSFGRLREAHEQAARGTPERKLRNEAAVGEASCVYWLARWQQRLLAPFLPVSSRLRARLARLYERSMRLLEEREVNDVNELSNPVRSLALVLSYENIDLAKQLARKAENLVRWTGDQQRMATVLRDVARVFGGSKEDSDLHAALAYWDEVLRIASTPSPEDSRKLTDPNGVSLAYRGKTETLMRLESANLSEAKKAAREGISRLRGLGLPTRSKAIHMFRFWILKTMLAFRR